MARDIPRPPSLPAARETARDVLDRYGRTNVHDHLAVVEAVSAFRTALRLLLDALDYREGS